jgi:hypothetical protein
MGISVQQIYCYCLGQTTYSVFREAPDACSEHSRSISEGCCKKAAPSCCAKTGFKSQDDRNCTKKTVKVLQLKVDFLVGHPLDKVFDCPIWAGELPDYLRLYRPVICAATLTNKAPPASPPPLSGRMICLRHELFRC